MKYEWCQAPALNTGSTLWRSTAWSFPNLSWRTEQTKQLKINIIIIQRKRLWEIDTNIRIRSSNLTIRLTSVHQIVSYPITEAIKELLRDRIKMSYVRRTKVIEFIWFSVILCIMRIWDEKTILSNVTNS